LKNNMEIEINTNRTTGRDKDKAGFLLASLLAVLAHYYKININGKEFNPYEKNTMSTLRRKPQPGVTSRKATVAKNK